MKVTTRLDNLIQAWYKNYAAEALSTVSAGFQIVASKRVAQKPLDYWLWRVSEGGTAEPFHSQGSVMPAWKYHLLELERWQVIAFARTLHQAAD
jgi:hypothetical protein